VITSPSAVARLAMDALDATVLREAKCSMDGDTWRHGFCGAEGAGSKVKGWKVDGKDRAWLLEQVPCMLPATHTRTHAAAVAAKASQHYPTP